MYPRLHILELAHKDLTTIKMSKAVEEGYSEWLKRWRFQKRIRIYKKYQIDIVIKNTAL